MRTLVERLLSHYDATADEIAEEAAARIAQLEADAAAIRRAALEEAAEIATRFAGPGSAAAIEVAIRALADAAPGGKE